MIFRKNKGAKLNTQTGFSLVELMVVVAIIGILASVAVPQFQKFTFKARMTEAKAGLSSLYTAEKAFYSEWSEFDTRFGVIGYGPEGNYSFNLGFSGAHKKSANYQTANGLGGKNPEPVDAMAGHVYLYCNAKSNTKKCKTLTSVPKSIGKSQLAGAAFANCTVDNSKKGATFVACAQATSSLNPDGLAPQIAINNAKDWRSNVGL